MTVAGIPMDNDRIRSLVRAAIVLIVIALAVYTIGWIFAPFIKGLFHQLANTLQYYLSVYTSHPDAGEWAAWILLALVLGMLNRALITAAGAALVLIITIGFLTRGPVFMIPQQGGQMVHVQDPSVRAMGQLVAFVLVGLLAVMLAGYVISVGIDATTPAILLPFMAHAGGYFIKEEARYAPLWVWVVIVGFVLFTIIAKEATGQQVHTTLHVAALMAIPATFIAIGYHFFAKTLGWRPLMAIVASGLIIGALAVLGQG